MSGFAQYSARMEIVIARSLLFDSGSPSRERNAGIIFSAKIEGQCVTKQYKLYQKLFYKVFRVFVFSLYVCNKERENKMCNSYTKTR